MLRKGDCAYSFGALGVPSLSWLHIMSHWLCHLTSGVEADRTGPWGRDSSEHPWSKQSPTVESPGPPHRTVSENCFSLRNTILNPFWRRKSRPSECFKIREDTKWRRKQPEVCSNRSLSGPHVYYVVPPTSGNGINSKKKRRSSLGGLQHNLLQDCSRLQP